MAVQRGSTKNLTNKAGYPYRPARLVDYKGDINATWYIIFYAFDITTRKLVRKRVGKEELNVISSPEVRRAEAARLVAELNEELSNTAHLESIPDNPFEEEIEQFDFNKTTVLEGLEFVRKHKRDSEKKSRSTIKGYTYIINKVTAFLEHEEISKAILLRHLSKAFLRRYFNYLRQVEELSNKTYNWQMGFMHSAIEVLRHHDSRIFSENPVEHFATMSVISKKHAAYSIDQVEQLKQLIEKEDPQLLLLIRFIYFTLARPHELRFVKVGHIRLDFKRLLIAGETAKTDIEEFVGISPALEKIIIESGILDNPPDWYVFSIDGKPGPVNVGQNYFNKRFRPFLKGSGLRKLNENYTLYSFKHTGAIQLYLATKDPYLLQKQCRHTTLEQTMTYLKDLGLFTDFSALEKWNGF